MGIPKILRIELNNFYLKIIIKISLKLLYNLEKIGISRYITNIK